MLASPAIAQGLPSVEDAAETCGNDSDTVARALGCSALISNPQADIDYVTYALWHRAYVRCTTESAPKQDIISDLMMSARLDPKGWQEQWAGSYDGPVDGVLRPEMYEVARKWVEGRCLE